MLRPYQQTGVRWLWQNFAAQTGCCLSADCQVFLISLKAGGVGLNLTAADSLLRKALKAISQLDEQVAECRMLDQLQPT